VGHIWSRKGPPELLQKTRFPKGGDTETIGMNRSGLKKKEKGPVRTEPFLNTIRKEGGERKRGMPHP